MNCILIACNSPYIMSTHFLFKYRQYECLSGSQRTRAISVCSKGCILKELYDSSVILQKQTQGCKAISPGGTEPLN